MHGLISRNVSFLMKRGKITCMTPDLHLSFFFLLVSLISIILPLWEGCCSWFDNFMFVDLPVCLKSYIQILLCYYCECICVQGSLSAFWLSTWAKVGSYWFYVEAWSSPFPNVYPASMLRRVLKKHIGDSNGISAMSTPKNLLPLPYAP